MNRIALAVLATNLIGCMSPPGEFTCENVPGWSFEGKPNCRRVERNLELATTILGFKLPEYPVVVLFDLETMPGYVGEFTDKGIILGCDGRAFMHEILHGEDEIEKVAGSWTHPQWRERGFHGKAENYEGHAFSVACPNDRKPRLSFMDKLLMFLK